MINNVTIVGRLTADHDAQEKTGISYQNIVKVVRGERQLAGGYKWKKGGDAK